MAELSRNPAYLKFAYGERAGFASPPHVFANFAASAKFYAERFHYISLVASLSQSHSSSVR